MNVLPAQGKCLYTKLDEDIPNPKKMIRNFNKVSGQFSTANCIRHRNSKRLGLELGLGLG